MDVSCGRRNTWDCISYLFSRQMWNNDSNVLPMPGSSRMERFLRASRSRCGELIASKSRSRQQSTSERDHRGVSEETFWQNQGIASMMLSSLLISLQRDRKTSPIDADSFSLYWTARVSSTLAALCMHTLSFCWQTAEDTHSAWRA